MSKGRLFPLRIRFRVRVMAAIVPAALGAAAFGQAAEPLGGGIEAAGVRATGVFETSLGRLTRFSVDVEAAGRPRDSHRNQRLPGDAYGVANRFVCFPEDDGGVSVFWEDRDSGNYRVTRLEADLTATTFAMPVSLGRFGSCARDGEGNWYYVTFEPVEMPPILLVKTDPRCRELARRTLDWAAASFNVGELHSVANGVRLRHADGILAMVMARTMYTGHQGSIIAAFDSESLATLRNHGQNASHSFDSRILHDGDGFVVASLGDNYPRGIVLSRVTERSARGRVVFTYKTNHGSDPASSNDNRTYTHLGDLIDQDAGIGLLVASERSIDNELAKASINESRNLAYLLIARDFESFAQEDSVVPEGMILSEGWTSPEFGFNDFGGGHRRQRNRGVVWLTSYDDKDTANAARPKMIALGNGRNLVLWETWTPDRHVGTHGMVIDEMGRVLQGEVDLGDVRLSAGDRIITSGGRVHWATSDGSDLEWHVLDVDARLRGQPTGPPSLRAPVAEGISAHGAVLVADLDRTGDSPTEVFFCWGGSDKGRDLEQWDHVEALGVVPRGRVRHTVHGLPSERVFHFRVLAVNDVGEAWTPGVRFTTDGPDLLAAGVEASYEIPIDGAEDASWFQPDFDESRWRRGPGGFGFEERGSDYEGLIATDVQDEMFARQASLRARWRFDVAEPASLTAASLRLQVDDGFVAWLNGVEIARRGAPDGIPAWDAEATLNNGDAAAVEGESHDLTPFLHLIRTEGNVLAIQVMNDTPDSSDLLLVPRVVGSRSPSVPLVSRGTRLRAWVPRDDSVDGLWMAPSFDDSGWDAGAGGVGYEEGRGFEELIGLDVGNQMSGRGSSCYLRIPFEVEAPEAFNALWLRIRFDDGFVAWLNGVEVARSGNVPDGPAPGWDASAESGRPDADAMVPEEIELSPWLHLLVPGRNMLAIHGLNHGADSSDFLVLPELVASVPPAPAFPSFEAWITSFGLGDERRAADPDGDGVSNHDEFVWGSHPGTPDAAGHQLRAVREGGRISLVVPVKAGRTYQVEWSGDLRTWHAVGAQWTADTDEDRLWPGGSQADESAWFYRVVAWWSLE